MLIRYFNKLGKSILAHTIYYPTPYNFTYSWNFGFISTVFLLIQIITGIFLTMHYSSDINNAFNSVEYIMRDVPYGWFIRYAHSNGASFFFISVYLHIARGLYYKSYNYENCLLWCSGVVIYFLMVVTAFIGYVLPWGQMSFWAATVITNLVTVIPFAGPHIVTWLWGGYSIGAPTLARFYTIHYLLPFILLAVVGLHFILLHEKGSTNPYKLSPNINRGYLFLYPYFIIKDFLGLFVFLTIYLAFIGYAPDYLSHPDNYVRANPISTPEHIVPEWYFLPFYAVLRSMPIKWLGVVYLLAAILILLFLPFISKYFDKKAQKIIARDPELTILHNRYIHPFFVYSLFVVFIYLGWLGSQDAIRRYNIVSHVLVHIYYGLILILPSLHYFTLILGKYLKNRYETVNSLPLSSIILELIIIIYVNTLF